VHLLSLFLFLLPSPYFHWDYHELENAVLGVVLHSFKWILIRHAPMQQ